MNLILTIDNDEILKKIYQAPNGESVSGNA